MQSVYSHKQLRRIFIKSTDNYSEIYLHFALIKLHITLILNTIIEEFFKYFLIEWN